MGTSSFRRMRPLSGLIVIASFGCGSSNPVDGIDRIFWSLEPEMRIDGYEHDLVPISAIAVSDSGDLAISQVQTSSVLIFDADGSLSSRVGRAGSGPGEFMFPHQVGWRADTLWVLDSQLQRLTFTSLDGDLVRESSLPRPAEPDAESTSARPKISQAVMPLPDGSILMRTSPSIVAGMDEWVLSRSQAPVDADPGESAYMRIHPSGETEEELARTWITPSVWSAELTTGARAGGRYPFPDEVYLAAALGGEHVAVVHAAVDGADEGTLRAVMLSIAGDTIYDRRYPFITQEIPRAAVDSAIAAAEGRWRALGLPEVAREFRRRAYIPRVRPPIVKVTVGLDGALWIGLDEGPEGHVYMVLRPDGEIAGHVQVPHNATVHLASDSFIWTVELDALDVPSVVRYVLQRPP